MSDINSQINRRIQAFVTELSALVRSAALEAVAGAFGTDHKQHAARASHAPKPSPVVHAAKHKAPARAAAAAPKAVVGRRTPAQIAATVASVLGYIRAHPRTRSELIRKALKLPRETMRDALDRLGTEKKIKMTGVKRGARYSAT